MTDTKRLRELLARATHRQPWAQRDLYLPFLRRLDVSDADMELIAEGITALPALLDEVDTVRERKIVQRVFDLSTAYRDGQEDAISKAIERLDRAINTRPFHTAYGEAKQDGLRDAVCELKHMLLDAKAHAARKEGE